MAQIHPSNPSPANILPSHRNVRWMIVPLVCRCSSHITIYLHNSWISSKTPGAILFVVGRVISESAVLYIQVRPFRKTLSGKSSRFVSIEGKFAASIIFDSSPVSIALLHTHFRGDFFCYIILCFDSEFHFLFNRCIYVINYKRRYRIKINVMHIILVWNFHQFYTMIWKRHA